MVGARLPSGGAAEVNECAARLQACVEARHLSGVVSGVEMKGDTGEERESMSKWLRLFQESQDVRIELSQAADRSTAAAAAQELIRLSYATK